MHWFRTYHKHHSDKLFMIQSTYDPCLLHTEKEGLFGIIGMQTDDTLFVGNKAFVELENNKVRILANSFNGGKIHREGMTIMPTQKKQGDKIELIDVKKTPFRETSVAQRARGAYIATVCQSEAAFDLSVAAQSQNPSDGDAKTLNKRLKWHMENKERGLRFIHINLESAKLFVFVDASFANNKGYSSQIGFVIVLANKDTDEGKGISILTVISSIGVRLNTTRNVLASELYVMVHGFDIGIAIKTTLDKILRRPVPLILCTDSRSLYDCLVKLGTTNEKRLMIDIMSLRQSYEKREIAEVRWIDGRGNPADAMTKGAPCGALKRLIDTNRLQVRVDGWVKRENMVV